MERFQLIVVRGNCRLIGKEALRDHVVLIEPVELRQLRQIELGMVLHRPHRALTERNKRRLHRAVRIAGQHDRARRQVRHFVIMDARRIEHRRLVRKHGMRAARIGQRNLARHAHFAPAR